MIATINPMRLSFIFASLLLPLLLLPATRVSASNISVQPLLLDLDVKGRDVVTNDITLTNETATKISVYATVNEISIGGSGEISEFVSPVMTDRTDTITSWVEITRGRIEFEPGETKTVPLTIRMHPYAKPGEYHAFIGFVPETKRPNAEALALSGKAEGLVLKVALKESSNDLLRISAFLVDRFVVKSSQRTIDVELENRGEKDSVPKGEIIFYNSRGEEVAFAAVNEAGVAVPAGEVKIFTTPIPFQDKLGRFKANVTMRYGSDAENSIFDTVQFFMMPLYLVIIIFFSIVVLSLLLTYLIRGAFRDELHGDDDGKDVPLYVRDDREHVTKDHDIHVKKT
jgi:hypothetical protein